jgi:hypothetical protein
MRYGRDRPRLLLTLEVGEEALLVESGALETERVDDVVDLDDLVINILGSLLGGSVGTGVNGESTLLDHGTIGLVDDAIDLLEIVGVGEELVTGEDILVDKHDGGLSRLDLWKWDGIEERRKRS